MQVCLQNAHFKFYIKVVGEGQGYLSKKVSVCYFLRVMPLI